jgi:hypothetical protein
MDDAPFEFGGTFKSCPGGFECRVELAAASETGKAEALELV